MHNARVEVLSAFMQFRQPAGRGSCGTQRVNLRHNTSVPYLYLVSTTKRRSGNLGGEAARQSEIPSVCKHFCFDGTVTFCSQEDIMLRLSLG